MTQEQREGVRLLLGKVEANPSDIRLIDAAFCESVLMPIGFGSSFNENRLSRTFFFGDSECNDPDGYVQIIVSECGGVHLWACGANNANQVFYQDPSIAQFTAALDLLGVRLPKGGA